MANEIKQAQFAINNGKVLRRINLLRHSFVELNTVKIVVEKENISVSEFIDCINFLSEENYIHLRKIAGKNCALLADNNYCELEAKVSSKGIRLLAGSIDDELVQV